MTVKHAAGLGITSASRVQGLYTWSLTSAWQYAQMENSKILLQIHVILAMEIVTHAMELETPSASHVPERDI